MSVFYLLERLFPVSSVLFLLLELLPSEDELCWRLEEPLLSERSTAVPELLLVLAGLVWAGALAGADCVRC